MILVKLKLWEFVTVFIKCFGLPLTYDYATFGKVWRRVIRHFGELFIVI
jgi:hypothetical protein